MKTVEEKAEAVALAVSEFVTIVAHRIAANPMASRIWDEEVSSYKKMQSAIAEAIAPEGAP